jgi:Mor family transcriptional regulator
MYNPCYEHSRHGDYWKAYDLITNVFTSEAAHKMSEVAKIYGNTTESQYFADAADALAEAVHENLTCDFNGKKIYMELIGNRVNGADHSGYAYKDEDGRYVYKGFSFVSLAPLAADWYAMDMELMKNTYDAYLAVGSEKYGKYTVLGVVVEPNALENGSVYIGNHVIGKGLAWELFYLWKTGDVERLEHLVNFVYDKSTDVYPEVWRKDGSVSDSANQEHANWILYSFALITGKYRP